MRDEASRVLDSVKETIAIGEQGGVPTQISHHKIIGKAYWGRSVETLKLVDEARARGVDATIDQYPYTASSTTIGAALMPAWAQEGGHKETVARFKDAAVRAKIKAAIADSIRNERGGGDPANIVVSLCEWDASLAGKNLSQLTLEDAVRKMSSYPAARIGLTDRGVLKPGMKADIAVFDPATVKDMATFEKPHQYAVGFPYVIVNG